MTAQGPQQPSEEALAEFRERVRSSLIPLLAARGQADARGGLDAPHGPRFRLGLRVHAERFATSDAPMQAKFQESIVQVADAACEAAAMESAEGVIRDLQIVPCYEAELHAMRAEISFRVGE